MTSYRLPNHTANVSLATLTEANRLMDRQAARIKELEQFAHVRVCNICQGTGLVTNLHDWRTGGKRSEKCWNCHPVSTLGRNLIGELDSLSSERAANARLTAELAQVHGQVQAALDKLWAAQDTDARSSSISELIEEAVTILQKVKIT